jgi:spore maturation protein CgeB
MRVVILGLSVTSSWGNGHATTYRGLMRGLDSRGHEVLFLERDQPWYAGNRDLPSPPIGRTLLYSSFAELVENYERQVRDADLVIVGSFVPEGARVGEWVTGLARGVTAFYDIDTPVTLAALETGACEYLSPRLIRAYDLYLSFTGGPTLRHIESAYGSPRARVLYCSVDPLQYYPEASPARWDLGYLGTYSPGRQPALERLLLAPARELPRANFAVVGPMYPDAIRWPANVQRTIHLEPALHRAFYTAQRFTLNITRAEMVRCGYSPSVRLFEAGACGTAVISDFWKGLDTLFDPGREILIAESADDVLRYLRDLSNAARAAIGGRARQRILALHTPGKRAGQLEEYVREVANDGDNVLVGPSCRNGHDRSRNHLGVDSGGYSERQRPRPVRTSARPFGGPARARDLQQPARAGSRNGGAAGASEKVEGGSP